MALRCDVHLSRFHDMTDSAMSIFDLAIYHYSVWDYSGPFWIFSRPLVACVYSALWPEASFIYVRCRPVLYSSFVSSHMFKASTGKRAWILVYMWLAGWCCRRTGHVFVERLHGGLHLDLHPKSVRLGMALHFSVVILNPDLGG